LRVPWIYINSRLLVERLETRIAADHSFLLYAKPDLHVQSHWWFKKIF